MQEDRWKKDKESQKDGQCRGFPFVDFTDGSVAPAVIKALGLSASTRTFGSDTERRIHHCSSQKELRTNQPFDKTDWDARRHSYVEATVDLWRKSTGKWKESSDHSINDDSTIELSILDDWWSTFWTNFISWIVLKIDALKARGLAFGRHPNDLVFGPSPLHCFR
jgi:hypothetical protein